MSAIDTGLSLEDALRKAPEFLRLLREGKLSAADASLEDAGIDVLHAACRLLTEPNAGELENPLADVRNLYDFIETFSWPGPDFEERAELLAACAFAGWRIARRTAPPPDIDEWQMSLIAAATASPLRPHLETDRTTLAAGGTLQDARPDIVPCPEALLPLLETLRQQWEVAPARVLEEASFVYDYLEGLKPSYPADAFLLDEREYFLGEAARIAAAVCRQLSLRDDVRRWLDLAEGWFLQTENASGNLAKVSYQRLALRTEERDFEAVRRLLPQLVSTFERLGMREDALKTRLLDALILKETDELVAAAEALNQIVLDAGSTKNDALQAWAYVNLVQVYGYLGDSEAAVAKTKEATPILRRVGNRIGLGKLEWGIGALLRSKSDFSGAIDAYRSAQGEFSELGMRADVASLHLVIADLLLDTGHEKQAEWEIRQALPLIDEYKLVPEGFAALALLRESLRRQTIDRQALRSLHGYFEELGS